MKRTWVATVVLLAIFAWAQPAQQDQQSQAQPKKDQKQDKSKDKDKDKKDKDAQDKQGDQLFTGTVDAKASKKSQDTATLGFKGVGPDGQVDNAKLNESPNGDDERVAQLMSGVKTNPDEAKVFVDNGKLKSR
jgi:cytoskeletal protein RodZ